MIDNGMYLIDATGDFVYYMEFEENTSLYGVQLNCYPLPLALPATYSEPANWAGYWGFSLTPQLIVPNTGFADVIGFNAGTYPNPAQATIYSKVSDYTPQVTPVQSVIVTCSLLNNKYSIPNTILYSFAPNGISFGDLYESRPPEIVYTPIQDGTYSDFDIQLLDQNFNALSLNDNNLVITVVFNIDDENDKKNIPVGGRIQRR